MNWKTIRANEFCESVRDGTHDTPKPTETGYKLVTGKHVKNGQIDPSDAYYISEKDYEKINERSLVEQWDVLMSMIGTVGEVAVVKDHPNYAIKNVALFKCGGSEIKGKWLAYYLRSSDAQGHISGNQKGSSQQFLSLKQLRSLPIPITDERYMQKVIDMLSAYDDLIENNQKQIKLLEEAAQRLYKEWFVDLRFPGHETTPIVDGVPEGWSRKTVEECLSFHGNGGWGKETPMGKNEHPGKVIRGTDIEDVKAGRFNDIPLRYHTDNDIKKRTLKIHDLVFELSNGNINNIGRCLFIDDLVLKNCGENTICASFCKLLRPVNRLHSLMLYWEIQEMQTSGRMLPLKKHGANGINNFDFDGFLNHELLIPTNASMLEPIEAIMDKISVIQGQFALLTEARDRLLPKLMSGEVEVKPHRDKGVVP